MNLAATALALVLLAACSKDSEGPPKPTIEGVEVFPGLSAGHPPNPSPSYPQVPPVGGPHSAAWLNCGVYDEPVPNVNAVHSLEHGAVWVTYRPTLSEDERNTVKRLHALNPRYVLVSPYDGIPAPVVASAWGLQLKVDRVDDPRLAAFVRQYAGGDQGGEGGAPCLGGGGLTLEEAIRYNASPPGSSAPM